MAACGLKGIKQQQNQSVIKNIHPVIKCILMANEMLNQAKKTIYGKLQKSIKIKIGIHYGDVIAGVIGGHKPQFSLIGDTVNTASRVCFNGEVDCITISNDAMSSCIDEHI
ncbi:hypothetical protein IMG5_105690 [Ichthyophthirius multifiliis]|uniref:Guanylate cyclase domain-containing protein n=1 Tax=Ichthyophthirius multifiliis TaxID=5932 RepID=G0QT30_ICHMU|nr:hypothetical protein IMG5_105690 [Ichthyophthirius multifiliis]EGR31629.1 hypothetical protein IMG5_105690 [Ichthyophthirius multifiliis]|eukprot:XP_004035115.1 hypothetical protein IMG5_105690 [Ichthyophthirius multifiliis]